MTNETKIKEFEDKIKRFESLLNVELKYLKEEVEALKQKEPEPWPRVGDYYYSVLGGDGSVISCMFGNDTKVDEFRISTNNIHRTKEQALRHKEYITSPRVRARELVEMCEGFYPLAEEAMLWYHKDCDTIQVISTVRTSGYIGGLTFHSESSADAALKKLGEPLIKVALGVIVGEEAELIVREYVGRGE